MIHLKNDFLEIEIDAKRAEVKKVYHRQFKLDYLWNGDPAFWNRSSPILFPIVGKLKNNTYTYQNNTFHLSQHGFARDTDFILEQVNQEKAIFMMSSTPESLTIYPFKFRLYITYTLANTTLNVVYKVVCDDVKEMLFSIGAHPGFNCPLEQGLSFEDYQLVFEEEEQTPRLLVGTNGISRRTEKVFEQGSKTIPLTYDLFGTKDAIIFKGLASSYMTLMSAKAKHGLRFHFKGFPYMGIWTKPSPFLCIEPWYGIADFEDGDGKLENKEGMVRLNPGKMFEAEYKVDFF